MKEHHPPAAGRGRGRRIAGRAQEDHIIDPYQRQRKLPEPARCPDCGAVYQQGRWLWMELPPVEAEAERCPACRRIADDYPAGIVTLKGAFVQSQKTEILRLARNVEEAEKREHPLNRIMGVDEKEGGELVISTTDVHLPRRIGEALHRAFHGELDVHYDKDNYFTRVTWQRNEND